MANGFTQNLFTCTLSRNAEFLMNIYMLHMRPLIEYASSLWNVGYMGDMRLLKRVQRRWTCEVGGLEDLSYRERLKRLDLFFFRVVCSDWT